MWEFDIIMDTIFLIGEFWNIPRILKFSFHNVYYFVVRRGVRNDIYFIIQATLVYNWRFLLVFTLFHSRSDVISLWRRINYLISLLATVTSIIISASGILVNRVGKIFNPIYKGLSCSEIMDDWHGRLYVVKKGASSQ